MSPRVQLKVELKPRRAAKAAAERSERHPCSSAFQGLKSGPSRTQRRCQKIFKESRCDDDKAVLNLCFSRSLVLVLLPLRLRRRQRRRLLLLLLLLLLQLNYCNYYCYCYVEPCLIFVSFIDSCAAAPVTRLQSFRRSWCPRPAFHEKR